MSTATLRSSSLRRRLQFRLRTMLAAMLLVCLGLTFWSVYIRPYRQEARIIAQLQEHGAVVTTETEGPAWLRAIAGDEFFRRIALVEIVDTETFDDDLRLLTAAPRLRALVIVFRNEAGPETALRHLREMRDLRELYIQSATVTIGPVEFGSPPTDETLRHIGECKQLRKVLAHGAFTDRGLEHFAGLSECESLSLASQHLGDAGVAHLGSLTRLQELRLYGAITDKSMPNLESLTDLESLTCEGDPQKYGFFLALASRTQYEFIDVPLIDAAQYFSAFHEIPIRLDAKEIEAAGGDPLAPFTGKSTSESLREVLERICESSQLDYIIRKDEIVITTPVAAAESRRGITALQKQLPKLKNVNVPW